MAYIQEGGLDMEKVVAVEFEPAGWRTTGDVSAPKSVKQAYDDAVEGLNRLVSRYAGLVMVPLKEGDYHRVNAVVSERVAEKLAAQPFVGKEYPDQVKSTLKILSPR